MYYFEDIINEIEENLTREIDINKLAKKATMSVYEFRRIFSFIAKISFGEYIRKRRLSLAALELCENKSNITEISIKYGYSSPSSFTRAFKEFHGISPLEVINGNRYDTGNVNDYFKAVVDFAYDIPELNQYIKSKIIKNDGEYE